MSIEFNLTGLNNIYSEALKRSDPTLVFEINNGLGKFVFMMFFSKEDEESKDRLFIHLRATNVLLQLKAYGSHRKGDFIIYFNKDDEDAIIDELQLEESATRFNFNTLLQNLNQQIPTSLPLQNKLDKIREVWPLVNAQLSRVIDDADKTNLIEIKKLPEGSKPRDKTLRKLYIHTNGNAAVISNLIMCTYP